MDFVFIKIEKLANLAYIYSFRRVCLFLPQDPCRSLIYEHLSLKRVQVNFALNSVHFKLKYCLFLSPSDFSQKPSLGDLKVLLRTPNASCRNSIENHFGLSHASNTVYLLPPKCHFVLGKIYFEIHLW